MCNVCNVYVSVKMRGFVKIVGHTHVQRVFFLPQKIILLAKKPYCYN